MPPRTKARANTTYSYRVRAYNAVGDSAYSNASSATTIPSAPPAAPSNLGAALVTPDWINNWINLTWQANSNDATGFRIERKTGAAGSWSQIATVGAGTTTYGDRSLTRNTTYYYRVRAYNSAGDSSYSNEAGAFAMAPPRAPSNLIATALSSSTIGLTWRDNADKSAEFAIERRPGVGGSWSEIGKVGRVATYSDRGLSANTTYSYRVRAYTLGGTSYSNDASATTAKK